MSERKLTIQKNNWDFLKLDASTKKPVFSDEDVAKLSEAIQQLFNGEYVDMDNVEILNCFPNSYGLEFSERDLEDYANNTNEVIAKNLLKPNVKMSHSDQQLILKEVFKMADVDIWEELPNLGLLQNFRRKGKSLYADIKQVPKVLKDLIFGGRLFTSLSPELVKNWRDSGKNIIRAIALSNIPSMKHVVDLPMSQGLSFRGNIILEDGGNSMGGENKDTLTIDVIDEKLAKNNEGLLTRFSEMIKSAIGKGKEKDDKNPEKDDASKEKVISLSEVQTLLSDQAEKFQQQLNEVNLKLIQKDKEVQKLSDDTKNSKLVSKKAEAEAICKKAGMEGVPPYVINLFKPILMSEAGDQVIMLSEKVGDETVEVKKPINAIVQDLFTNYPNKANMSEITQTFMSDESLNEDRAIANRVNELMSQNPNMSQHEALSKAGAEIRK